MKTAAAHASAVFLFTIPDLWAVRLRADSGSAPVLDQPLHDVDLGLGPPHVLESMLLTAATRHVEFHFDVAGAEAEKLQAEYRVHDDVVAAFGDLKIQGPVALGLTGQRRTPADLTWIDEAVREARVNEGDVHPENERDGEHDHVIGEVHV